MVRFIKSKKYGKEKTVANDRASAPGTFKVPEVET
jgi:hypothetical protein